MCFFNKCAVFYSHVLTASFSLLEPPFLFLICHGSDGRGSYVDLFQSSTILGRTVGEQPTSFLIFQLSPFGLSLSCLHVFCFISFQVHDIIKYESQKNGLTLEEINRSMDGAGLYRDRLFYLTRFLKIIFHRVFYRPGHG